MTSSQRREKILNCLHRQKSVSVNVLIEMFGVSGMTIRRDLNYLVEHGLVTRAYGKVSLAEAYSYESTFDTREVKNLYEYIAEGKRFDQEEILLNPQFVMKSNLCLYKDILQRILNNTGRS